MHEPSAFWRTIVVEYLVLLAASTGLAVAAALAVFQTDGTAMQWKAVGFVAVVTVLLGLAFGLYSTVRLRALDYDSRHWRREALIDRLTGIMNRNGFQSAFKAKALTLGRDGELGMMLMIVDADHFKRINDRLGHPAGDRALKAIAATLGGALRRNDVVGRLGGEEFGVLVSCATAEQGTAIAERMRTTIGTLVVGAKGATMPVTVSIGAVFCGRSASFAAMYEAADGNCYRAKRAGRNRTVTSSIQPGAVRKSHFGDTTSAAPSRS